MKLFYAPGACSIGIHILLEEIGKPFETQAVSLKDGQQFAADFVRLNPKSKVPTLQLDSGAALTEFPAIALYLARSNPQAKLLPEDAEGQGRAMEAADYCVATIHMQGFSRWLRPGKFAPSEADHEKVRAQGRETFVKGLDLMDKALAGRDYVAGSFSIGDAALFYVTMWGVRRLELKPGPNLAAFWERMNARPAVQRVMRKEGLAG